MVTPSFLTVSPRGWLFSGLVVLVVLVFPLRASESYKEKSGSEGNGSFTIGPEYKTDPDLTDRGNPKGKSFEFSMPLAESKIFKGDDSTLEPEKKPVNKTRKISIYVPVAYQDGAKAPMLIIHDGPGQLNLVRYALDNLTISRDPNRKLPPFIAIAVQNGGNDGKKSERGLEYDTMSDRLARFIHDEVLPAVLANADIKAAYPQFALTENPWGRAVMGCSSGGAAALTMGWFRPDWYRRIIAYSGTFVDQQDDDAPEEAKYPFGAWEYHSGMKLIENSEPKPLRIFTHVSENDLRPKDAEETHHNWVMAGKRTDAALTAKGYNHRFIYSLATSHCDGRVFQQTLADTLVWIWRGYQPGSAIGFGQTARIAQAAQALIDTLDEAQRAKVTFKFADKEQRTRWSNLPAGMVERRGLRMGSLTPGQRTAVMTLLSVTLSKMGYEKILGIMDGDEVLKNAGGGSGPAFGRDEFYISFLGTPSATRPWMLQFGGHHLALNVTFVGEEGVMTPSLIAVQPARYSLNGRTVRPLGRETDKAFDLVNSLNANQRKEAVLGFQMRDLVLGPGHDGETIQPEGIKASALTDHQQQMLLDLVAEWSGIIHDAAAAEKMIELKANLADTWFAWSGPTEPGSASYFRVQGPTVVIEYAPQKLGGDPTQHIHTMYRDFTNDYGKKLLAQ